VNRTREPSVTVVIPVRNRPDAIVACLRSLAAMDFPAERLDVIVVDDASTDGTREAVQAGPASRVRLLARETHSGQSACRNAGAAEAGGDVLAFIDSDCIASPEWLKSLVGDFDDPSVVAVGGGVHAKDPVSWIERYEAVASPLYKGSSDAEVVPGSSVDALASCNLLVRRASFLESGGFDAALRFGEDVDLVWRLRGNGGRILYRHAGAVDHDYRSRVGEFAARRVHYVTAQGMFLRRHPRNGAVFDIPVGLVAGAAIAGVAAGLGRPELVPLALVPAVADAVVSSRGRGVGRGIELVARAYASALYRILSRAGRHYALLLAVSGAIALPFWSGARWLMVAAVAALIVPAVAEWLRARPAVPISFVAAHVIDSIAINVGTIWGCIVHRTLRPLGVRVSLHATAASMPDARRPVGEPGLVP
jgi:mycofactocin glycosyltransferase